MFKFSLSRTKYSTIVYFPLKHTHMYVFHSNPEDPFFALIGPANDDPEMDEHDLEELFRENEKNEENEEIN